MHPLSPRRPQRATVSRSGFRKRPFILVSFFLGLTTIVLGQAPTSLQYPASNTFSAFVTNVYLAPTVSGSVTSYSVAPALPAGLSLNTITGVISGVPTTATTAAAYTVTATNGAGSATSAVNIGVTSTFYDNNLGAISFLDAARTFKVGTTGQVAGDKALYTGVVTIGSQTIDCIVTTVAVTNVTSWDAYDQQALSGTYFSNNQDKFFSPQVTFGTGGGNIMYDFQFILGGSYNNLTNTGTNVTLRNVYLNTYDIDGNGTASSNQYNEYEDFSAYEILSPAASTNINVPVYDATTGLSKFLSKVNTNNSTVTDNIGRIRLTYDKVSSFRVRVGAGATGLAYFFLDLSAGDIAFTGSAITNNIALDLNTNTQGLDNGDVTNTAAVNFARAATTNITSSTALNELRLTYDNTAANLPDGAIETLFVNGATAGIATHILNFASGSTSSVTVGGVAYTITKTVSGNINTIVFTNGSTFTLTQAEALLDALQYQNTSATSTNGSRSFSVQLANTEASSPVAVYAPTINAVSIAGNIYHDVNGITDNTVDASATGTTGTATGQFAANGVYAVLTNASTNAVIATVGVSAGGAYSFGRRNPGNYNVFISNSATPGATMTTSTYPASYASTGENLGAATGTDGLIDSKMALTVGNVLVSAANLGIQMPPTATNVNETNKNNPGGYNFFSIPVGDINAADADGSLVSIRITAFPTGANYLKVGSTLYTNGGGCPPQSSCTTWPGTVDVPIASIGTLAIDPTATGATSVILSYTALDNAAARSNGNVATTITIPFVVTSTVTVSGSVWNDANGDGVKDATEAYSAAASSGQALYALLIQKSNTYSGANTILASSAVTAVATSYSFSNVPSGNDYEVRIVSLAAAPSDGVAKSTVSAALATGYTGVSTNNGGAIAAAQNTNDLINALGVVSVNKTAVGFGIERAPDTWITSATITQPATNSLITLSGGSNPPVFTGSDPEDQPATATLSTKTVGITALPVKGQLWYNATQITKGIDNINPPSVSNPFKITNFDPTKMQVKFTATGYNTTNFSYAYIDAAGTIDPTPATYTLSWTIALPVRLLSFAAKAVGSSASVNWSSADEVNFKEYVLERSLDGANFTTVATVAAKGGNVNEYTYAEDVSTIASAKLYYRLQQVDNDGKSTYSAIVSLSLVKVGAVTLSVTPNPVKSAALLTINSVTNGSGVIRITDYSGKIVLSKTVSINAGTTTVQLENNKQLPNGMYVVSLEINGDVRTQRFVVQR